MNYKQARVTALAEFFEKLNPSVLCLNSTRPWVFY
jgi:hypothetical protein